MKTKKMLTLLALVILGIGAAHAQIPGFTIGVKAGYVYSTMTKGKPSDLGRFSSDVRPRHGGSGGVFARINIGKGGKNYFQPEINFDQQGGDFYFIPPNNIPYHVIARVNRFDFPLLYGYKFSMSKKASFRINIGPEISLKTTGVNRHLEYIPTNYQYRAANVGAIAGIGADLGNVTFDLRYDLGLTTANPSFDTKLSSAFFSIGYKFF